MLIQENLKITHSIKKEIFHYSTHDTPSLNTSKILSSIIRRCVQKLSEKVFHIKRELEDISSNEG